MTVDEKTLCVVCAWREDCRKKFRVSAGDAHCPDFCRDVRVAHDLPAESEKSAGEKQRH
ncbi:MAG: hypothetical protein JXO49_11110 [Deltaproteobacteria bacterium]|nr:hypothetical protein [Candidatus Anaeroferrophillus wilburensis]MBN2889882.1 hypothetical protein [Deltaproteobacteria bacterium]